MELEKAKRIYSLINKTQKNDKDIEELRLLCKDIGHKKDFVSHLPGVNNDIKEVTNHFCGYKRNNYFDNARVYGFGKSIHERKIMILNNYVDRHRPYIRYIYAWDYKLNKIFKIASSENNENLIYGCVNYGNPEFMNLTKQDVIRILLYTQPLDEKEQIYRYCKGTVRLIGKVENFGAFIKKVKAVKTYRLGICFGETDKVFMRLKDFYEKKDKIDGYKIVQIIQQVILENNKKKKFLYKKPDGGYYHIMIEDETEDSWVGKNYLGYALIKHDKASGIIRIYSLFGNAYDKKDSDAIKKEVMKKKYRFQMENFEEQKQSHIINEKYELERKFACIKEALLKVLGEEAKKFSFMSKQLGELDESLYDEITKEVLEKYPHFDFDGNFMLVLFEIEKEYNRKLANCQNRESDEEYFDNKKKAINDKIGNYIINYMPFIQSGNFFVYDNFEDDLFPFNYEEVSYNDKREIQLKDKEFYEEYHDLDYYIGLFLGAD